MIETQTARVDDSNLRAWYQHRDHAAFKRFTLEYLDLLVGYLCNLGHREPDLPDVCNSALLRLATLPPWFDQQIETPEMVCLYADYASKQHWEDEAKGRRLGQAVTVANTNGRELSKWTTYLSSEAVEQERRTEALTPDELAAEAEYQRKLQAWAARVRAAVPKITNPDHRRAFELHEHGLSHREIAAEMGLQDPNGEDLDWKKRRNQVAVWYMRAKEELAELVGPPPTRG
jgi:DNA-directed RNA polymerase specialized sigma24 family protein